ncbi:hypothetical protein PG999_010168 [Apiospora kogelbergensis]|uniref:Uncharacterized protein n=1 Tax=Apiospora kogelbergensis TaxID=1337665 RepID=A0AAW0QJ92_9PEZI
MFRGASESSFAAYIGRHRDGFDSISGKYAVNGLGVMVFESIMIAQLDDAANVEDGSLRVGKGVEGRTSKVIDRLQVDVVVDYVWFQL